MLAIKYAVKLAVRLPDHEIAMNLFEHQGILYLGF